MNLEKLLELEPLLPRPIRRLAYKLWDMVFPRESKFNDVEKRLCEILIRYDKDRNPENLNLYVNEILEFAEKYTGDYGDEVFNELYKFRSFYDILTA